MTTAVGELPVLDVDAPGFIDDPLPQIEAVRRTSWIARSSRGLEVLTYEGCEAAFHNRGLLHGIRRLLEQMGVERTTISGQGRNFLTSEGEDHTTLRRVVSRWFTPRSVDRLRERVRELVESLVAPVTAAGGGEFKAEVASHVPGPVFCWMVGASGEQGDALYELSERLQPVFTGDPNFAEAFIAAGKEMKVFVDELTEIKRREPGDDLMSILIEAEDAGDITAADVHSIAFELLGASTDNTANSASLAVELLATHPDEWAKLRADRALVPTAVEECARCSPRVRYANQWSPDGTRLLDFDIPARSDVWLALIGACYDPAVYPDPHRFDVARLQAKPQLNFGAGRHFCIGAALARMELQVVLDVLAERWATLELAGPADVSRTDGTSVASVPIAVTPA